MRHRLTTALAVIATLALAMTAMFAVRPAGAASGTLATYLNWDSSGGAQGECDRLGYSYGTKVESPNDGTYPFDEGGGTFTLTWSSAPGTTERNTVTWSSTFGIDAVILKAGENANVYTYNPEATSDSGLVTPNNASGKPAAISHITLCYDFEVTVSKTAHTSFDRSYDWTLEKSVSPDKWDLFSGNTGTSEYTVTATRSGPVDSNWAVSGEITIENDTPFAATITDVTDSISGYGAVKVTCPGGTSQNLDSGDTLTCTYSTALPNGSGRTNTATVTTSGTVGGGTATAPVTFGAPTNTYDETLDVTDTNDMSWTFTGSISKTYSDTFSCSADEGKHVNTVSATLHDGSKLSDSATVTVNCYELSVTKDAHTSFNRDWDWTIAKSGDRTELILALGQQFLVNYTVTVDADSTDSAWAVSGEIKVANPAPIAATINSVSDLVSPSIAANVACSVSFPYTLVAGATLTCTYDADLPDATSRTNTATATQQNYNYAADGSATPAGTTSYSGTAAVTFGTTPTKETDECIDVIDDQYGSLGKVCAGDAPKTFTYSLKIKYDFCGDYTYKNVASFTTNDSSTTGSDDHSVTVKVPCDVGCTLTQGYWKTHSREGPAPYDDAWKNIGPLEEDTLFFNSGKTWYEVFWTAPAGNAYYNLAHQYMAAKLNVLNGAAPASVSATLTAAEALFNAQGAGDTTLSRAERTLALSLATTLDNYNNGLIGPGHCSEAASLTFTAGQHAVWLPLVS